MHTMIILILFYSSFICEEHMKDVAEVDSIIISFDEPSNTDLSIVSIKPWMMKLDIETCATAFTHACSRLASTLDEMFLLFIPTRTTVVFVLCVFYIQLRSASGLERVRVLLREFMGDIRALWRYGAPFPTFLKLLGTLLLCLLVTLPLVYPIFVIAVTYFTCESLYLSWWLDQPWRFLPITIVRRILTTIFRQATIHDVLKVREVLTRGILLAHSLATSVDYLCVMQGLLDET